jgi:hypothetical protein
MDGSGLLLSELFHAAIAAVFGVAVDYQHSPSDVQDPVFGDAGAGVEGGFRGEVKPGTAICNFDGEGEFVATGWRWE